MTAQEFGQWQTWFDAERQHPVDGLRRHAEVLSSLANGALTRKSGGLFTARELMPPDPWAPPAPPTAPAGQQTVAELLAQVEQINASMG